MAQRMKQSTKVSTKEASRISEKNDAPNASTSNVIPIEKEQVQHDDLHHNKIEELEVSSIFKNESHENTPYL
jgi:hypothetical protein